MLICSGVKMGTCEQKQGDQQETPRQEGEGGNQEESNLTITGPPASRTVIDNLKKLLVQRQHSRESDTENKNAARSNSGSNSDAAFYSQFSTSSSDSDDSSDDYMIFQEISNQGGCTNNGTSTNHNGRRRHRRRRSYSSSSSSSSSPVARSRRKVTRVNVTLTNSVREGGLADSSNLKPTPGAPKSADLPLSQQEPHEGTKEEHDSANSTSSHKDSSSEVGLPGSAQGHKSISSSAEATGPVSAGRCPKLKSRRDRDRKRKRSELNYATHRPKLLKQTESTTTSTTVTSHTEGTSVATSLASASATGGTSENKTSVPTTATASVPIDLSAELEATDAAAVNPSEISYSSTFTNQNKSND